MTPKHIAIRSPLRQYLWAFVLLGSIGSLPVVFSQSAASSAPTDKAASPPSPTRYVPNRPPRRKIEYYTAIWDVDSFSLKSVEVVSVNHWYLFARSEHGGWQSA
jgi:hypothetical protein